jgi:hypothetical protein
MLFAQGGFVLFFSARPVEMQNLASNAYIPKSRKPD